MIPTANALREPTLTVNIIQLSGLRANNRARDSRRPWLIFIPPSWIAGLASLKAPGPRPALDCLPIHHRILRNGEPRRNPYRPCREQQSVPG